LICRDANSNGYIGMYIDVSYGVEAEFIVKGKVTFNSNGLAGMYSFLYSNSNLEIDVETGSTLESCGNDDYDIYGYVAGAATFSGDGSYTCDQAVFNGGGTVVPPNCQDCS
jgi:hypothetical protein